MKRIGLALGSGGALGFAHIGVIKALEEENINFDIITGSSAGAVVGGYYALYKDIDKLETMALEFVKEQPFKLFDFTNIIAKEKKEKRIKLFLEEQFREYTFKNLKLIFGSVAADLETGEEVVITKGRLLDAIFASMAVPGVFGPVFFWGKWLVDGGVVNPTPISAAKQLGAEKVIAVDLTKKKPITIDRKPKSFFVIARSLDILIKGLDDLKTKNIEDKIIIYPKFKKTKDLFSVDVGKQYIDIGYKTTKGMIDEIKKFLESD